MSIPSDTEETRIPTYVCAGPSVLGRHGNLEGAFRRFLDVILQERHVTLPPLVSGSVADHASRTDADGRTLCFAGPLREAMLDTVVTWLQSRHATPMQHEAHATPSGTEQLVLPL
jgi:hypothetical protein